jgi:hypothetical protein
VCSRTVDPVGPTANDLEMCAFLKRMPRARESAAKHGRQNLLTPPLFLVPMA